MAKQQKANHKMEESPVHKCTCTASPIHHYKLEIKRIVFNLISI